jgi:glycine hydroxymethyltransferase
MPTIKQLIAKETKRQNETLDLIPSENIASPAVRDALSSLFVNKYAEGYPGKRYYPGNAVADEMELYVQDLVRKVFKLKESVWRVNVQPYSGSPANAAIYLGLLDWNDTILGMSLTHGGHLTHGHRVTFSGRAFRAVHYGVGVNGRIDYDQVAKLAKQHKPKMLISGASAYPREIDFSRMGAIAKSVGAMHFADVSHIAGLIAAGVHKSPFGHADIVMMTTQKTLRGPRGAIIISRADYNDVLEKAVFPGFQGGPHLHTIAGIGVTLEEAQKSDFVRYQEKVVKNAKVLAETLAKRGFALLSGGTDNHLMLADMRVLGLGGNEAEKLLEQVGIIANRNTVPEDPAPFKPSGIRMGTPSVTSRGMGAREMQKIGRLIAEVLVERKRPAEVRAEVKALCAKFPIKG